MGIRVGGGLGKLFESHGFFAVWAYSAVAGTCHERCAVVAVLGSELAGSASAVGDEIAKFRPGVTVRHPEYGLGRIVSIDGAGPNRKGRVAFAVGTEKTFVLAMSPLKTVGP